MPPRNVAYPTDGHADTFSGRTLRWYEWLLALALLTLAAGVRAETAFRCDASDGAIIYQAHPCAADQRERRMAFDAPPSVVTAPDYAVTAPPRSSSHAATRETANVTHVRAGDDRSYECRASDGEVFYRHAGCPHSLPGAPSAGKGRGAHPGDAKTHVTVSARPVSRSEACAAIHRAGAIGRDGHAHDEDVSTYERNLGRDPCK